MHKLIYVESFDNPRVAIAREKQIKAWRREKKRNLIATLNPDWTDLAKSMVLR